MYFYHKFSLLTSLPTQVTIDDPSVWQLVEFPVPVGGIADVNKIFVTFGDSSSITVRNVRTITCDEIGEENFRHKATVNYIYQAAYSRN